MWYGRVNYYNPDIYHGHHFDVEAAFWKQDRYSYQSEFGFVIDTRTERDDAVTLEVGDMRDIAMECRSADFNETFLGLTTCSD